MTDSLFLVPLPFWLLILVACHCLLWLVAGDINKDRYGREQNGIVLIWVMAHACMMTVCWIAPSGLWFKCCAMLFCVFIFRLSLVDQLTGLLPREMTVSCLTGGLLFAAGIDVFPAHLAAAAIIWCVLFAWRTATYWLYGEEMLGLGDVWIGSALGAWLGLMPALYAIALGAGGFFIWLSCSRSGGGPMGPWLGGSAMLAMVVLLFKPELMW